MVAHETSMSTSVGAEAKILMVPVGESATVAELARICPSANQLMFENDGSPVMVAAPL